MNKIFPILSFSILLLIPVGVQNTFAGGPGCVPPPPNMVSWWPGDGNTNDIVDSNPGALLGAGFGAGKVLQGFSVGGGSLVSMSDASNLEPQQLTLDAWVNAFNVGQLPDTLGPVIVSKDNDIIPQAGLFPDVSYGIFGPGTTGQFTALVDTTDNMRIQVTSLNSFAFNQFHHVAMTWDGITIALYVNGQLEGTASSGPKIISYDESNLGIGAHTIYTPSRYFNGIIDEVELFNTVLSQSQIQTIYNADSAGKCKIPDPPEPPERQLVAGKIIPTESAALLIAGLQTSAIWLAPVVISAVGLGIVLVKRKF